MLYQIGSDAKARFELLFPPYLINTSMSTHALRLSLDFRNLKDTRPCSVYQDHCSLGHCSGNISNLYGTSVEIAKLSSMVAKAR